MSYQSHIVNVDHDARQLLKTVEQRLLPTIEKVHEFQNSEAARPLTATEKEPIANIFVTVASQLDNLWHHLRPEFDVQLIVPKDMPPPFAPPATLVMSRQASAEERDSSILPNEAAKEAEKTVLDEFELETLQQMQKDYRNALQKAVRDLAATNTKDANFTKQMKKSKDQRERELTHARRAMDEARDAVRKSILKM